MEYILSYLEGFTGCSIHFFLFFCLVLFVFVFFSFHTNSLTRRIHQNCSCSIQSFIVFVLYKYSLPYTVPYHRLGSLIIAICDTFGLSLLFVGTSLPPCSSREESPFFYFRRCSAFHVYKKMKHSSIVSTENNSDGICFHLLLILLQAALASSFSPTFVVHCCFFFDKTSNCHSTQVSFYLFIFLLASCQTCMLPNFHEWLTKYDNVPDKFPTSFAISHYSIRCLLFDTLILILPRE